MAVTGSITSTSSSIASSDGFAVETPLITSLDGDRTATYHSAIHSRRDSWRPPDLRNGLATFLGRGPNFSRLDFINPYVHQFSLGIQRQLPWRTTVEATYVGSRTMQEQNRWGGFNEPSVELRNRCDPSKGRDHPPSVMSCSRIPFSRCRDSRVRSRFTSPTLSRYELSRPFPQFTGITELDRNDGKIWYNSAQFLINKRLSAGMTLAGTYTLSRMIEENGGGNQIGGNNTTNPTIADIDRVVQRSDYESDRRHRVTISGVYHLPFGKDRRFMNNANRVVDAVFGGWEVAGMWLFNSGRPWGLPQNVFLVKDAKIENVDFNNPTVFRAVKNCVGQMDNSGNVTMLGFSTAAGCAPGDFNWIIRPANYSIPNVPFRSDTIRRPPFYQFDVNFAKTTRIAADVRLQIRFELYNLLNQTIYDERNYNNNPADSLFGTIDRSVIRQSNFPRYGQLGLKLIF